MFLILVYGMEVGRANLPTKDSPLLPVGRPKIMWILCALDKPKPFGMWTCQKGNRKDISKNLKIYFGEKASNYLDLLYQWEEILGTILYLFLKIIKKQKKDLSCVRILHLAHRKHNGGDAQGNFMHDYGIVF